VRPRGRLRIDYPDSIGRLSKLGTGATFGFSGQGQTDYKIADIPGWQPTWSMDGTEVVPRLNVLKLSAWQTDVVNMNFTDWFVTDPAQEDLWRIERPDAVPSRDWLAFVLGDNPDNVSTIQNVSGLMSPNVFVRLNQATAPADHLYQPFVSIDLFSIATGFRWQIILPHGRQERETEAGFRCPCVDVQWITTHPTLGNVILGPYRISEFEDAAAGAYAAYDGPRRSEVTIEAIMGYLLIDIGVGIPWVVSPPREYLCTYSNGDQILKGFYFESQYFEVSVTFLSHAGMVNITPIVYPETGTASPPQLIQWTPMLYNPVAPTYGHVDVTHPFHQGAVAVTAETLPENPLSARPVVTLTRTSENRTPVVRLVHETRDSLRVTRSLYPTPGYIDSEGQHQLKSLKWSRNIYRGWTFSALLADPNGTLIAALHNAVGALPSWRCEVTAGWDESGGVPEDPVQIMDGYLTSCTPSRSASERMGTPMVEIQGGDYISTRLSGKVLMNDGPAAEGWDLAAWVLWWLRHWGYNGTFDAPTGTEAGAVVVKLPPDPVNPAFPPPRYTGAPLWLFERDADGLAAIDTVLRKYRWHPLAVNNVGMLYTGPDPLLAGWSLPATWNLSEVAATGVSIIREVSAETDMEEIRNFAIAIAPDGSAYPAPHKGSWADPTDPFYIGFTAWVAENAGDSVNPASDAQRLLRECLKARKLLRWSRLASPAIQAGHTVAVDVQDVGVPAGTVMRIIGEQGSMDFTAAAKGSPDATSSVYQCERIISAAEMAEMAGM